MTTITCPFCSPAIKSEIYGNLAVDCGKCGKFLVQDTAYEDYFCNSDLTQKNLILLRHYLYKALYLSGKSKSTIFVITSIWVEATLKNQFPSASEQLDNLISYLGKTESYVRDLDYNFFGHIIGSTSRAQFDAIVQGAKEKRLFIGTINIALSLDGWEKYESIKKGRLGYGAFMAMKFGDPELNQALDKCFKPAVNDTGFNLKKLDDEPKAGLIDNRMREAIKTSRFMIADLTHQNLGAYWEAGYAEGLGKVVIYTCKEQNKDKIHFDTSHHTTIFWDVENLESAREQLKSTIRLSISEALQEEQIYA